jgi:aspartate/methionine/tyrosine aminotransferase
MTVGREFPENFPREKEMALKNITEYEIPALPESFNLTDGHAYRSWLPEEERIIRRASEYFREVNRQMQFDLEREYISAFLALSQQSLNFEPHKYLMCTSASMSIEIVANYLRLKNLTLCLIEPCFDNIADICKRHNVPLQPFSDAHLDDHQFVDFLEGIDSDAIFLVSPNNPTGKTLTKDNFLALVDYCKKAGKLLIMDCAFRAYTPREQVYDQYGILSASGIDYLLIEDTGKTWPTVELKASILTVSLSLYKEIYDIYTDFILHVSPFIIKLITELMNLALRQGGIQSVAIVKANRDSLYKNLQGTILTPVEKPHMSVSWLNVHHISGFELKEILDRRGVHVLPGDYFYWSNHKHGTQFIRVALVRDPDVFSQAAALLGEVCREWAEQVNDKRRRPV